MTMAAKKKPRPPASDALLMLALEFLAVGLFTLIAGSSDEIGTLMTLFMVGLWLIYFITDSGVLLKLEKSLEVLIDPAKAATSKGPVYL